MEDKCARNDGPRKSSFCNHYSKDWFGRKSLTDAKIKGKFVEEQGIFEALLSSHRLLISFEDENSVYTVEKLNNALGKRSKALPMRDG